MTHLLGQHSTAQIKIKKFVKNVSNYLTKVTGLQIILEMSNLSCFK